MSFVVVIAVIAVFDAVAFASAFVLSIEAGVGVDVVCVIDLFLHSPKQRKRTLLPAPRTETPKLCAQS